MEDRWLYQLLEYFDNAIRIADIDGKYIINGEFPFDDFNRHSHHLGHRFIGECSRNIEIYKDNPDLIRREFSNILYKFFRCFKVEFSQPYRSDNLPDLSKLIPEEDELSNLKRQAVKSKLETYSLVIDFLDNHIQQFLENIASAKQKRNRIKAGKRDFITALDARQLSESFTFGRRLEFISSKTNKKDFIDIFQGLPSKGPIDWSGTVFSLNRFISGINGKAIKEKITDGKWEVISELFTVNGKNINPSSLRSPGRGKNDKLNDVGNLIDLMNSPEPLEE